MENIIPVVRVNKDKMLVCISITPLNPVMLVEWVIRYGNRLQAFHNGASNEIVEISDITYHEYLELLLDYMHNVNHRKVNVLYKGSENKHYNQLPRPRVDLYMYTE